MTQREIKFRAWDSQSHSMIFLKEYLYLNYKGKFEYVDGPDLETTEVDCPVMQYTGLKDKNGKEIYEGDIILSTENAEVYQITDIVPVHRHSHAENIGYFEGKKYNHRSAGGAYDNLDDWMSMTEFYEIIGNIYENPELIK